MMDGEQYFAEQPVSAERPREFEIELAGAPVTVKTAGGVFSPGGLDAGTAVLLARVPAPPQRGDLLDLGCGWGAVSITLARRAPDARVWGVDVNLRALELTRENARRAGVEIRTASPHGIPGDLRFAVIWSNPPIRIGKQALHELLETWLPRLDDGGSAWLVVAKHLGGDSLAAWIRDRFGPRGFSVRRAATDRGYRVLEVARTEGASATSPV